MISFGVFVLLLLTTIAIAIMIPPDIDGSRAEARQVRREVRRTARCDRREIRRAYRTIRRNRRTIDRTLRRAGRAVRSL